MDKNRMILAKQKLSKAAERLNAAKINYDLGQYEVTINRSYYSVFSSMKSVLALEGKEEKTHKQLIADFRKDFIKTKILPVGLSDCIQDTFTNREQCDYDDEIVSTKEKAKYCLDKAKYFFDTISDYVYNKIQEIDINQTLDFNKPDSEINIDKKEPDITHNPDHGDNDIQL